MAALIAGGVTEKSPAICGKDVEMMEESRPSMKNAPATTKGTIKGSFAGGGGSSLVTSVSATIQREFRISRHRQVAICTGLWGQGGFASRRASGDCRGVYGLEETPPGRYEKPEGTTEIGLVVVTGQWPNHRSRSHVRSHGGARHEPLYLQASRRRRAARRRARRAYRPHPAERHRAAIFADRLWSEPSRIHRRREARRQ